MSENKPTFLFHKRYWEVIENFTSRRKINDVCGALACAFFTGESQADRFNGDLRGAYLALERDMWFSRSKAESGRDGGKAKRKAKPQADVQANMEANTEANAKPNTNVIKKEKRNKKESGSTSASTSSVCPKCNTHREQVSPGVFRCPDCDITWTVRAG